jgi:3-phosphoshikimate 1-carboxyvinyltransferase
VTDWAAARATAPVHAVVRVPGSKSVTNRAFVLAALAPGRSRLRRPLRSRDTQLMAGALRALGVGVGDDGGDWVIDGRRPPLHPVAGAIDVGNAGTVARFVPPVATLADGSVCFDGDPRVRERPIGPLLAALRVLGADLDDAGRGALPVTVTGHGRLRGGEVTVDASSSSQLVSGLLLAAPRFDEGVTVRHVGSPLPSAPHLAMTVAMLRDAGADVDDTTVDTWRVSPGELRVGDRDIEPDLSSAAPFLAAALVTGGSVTVAGWPAATTQPGAMLPGLLEAMGATFERSADGLTVRGGGAVRGVDADLRDCGELAPVLTAVAAVADSPSRLRGIAHLRLQETDRLAALRAEVNGLGGDVRETEDGLEIRPRRLHAGTFHTYDDHRLAMAGAVLGLVVDGIVVENIETVGKTVPDFTGLWAAMLGGETG